MYWKRFRNTNKSWGAPGAGGAPRRKEIPGSNTGTFAHVVAKSFGGELENPERSDIRWDDLESMLGGLGGDISQGRGSRIRVALGGVKAVFHRPHPKSAVNYNEAMTLKEVIERYRIRHGFYPESLHVDKIYRTRDNIRYCLERGIRISGPKRGRNFTLGWN